MRACQGCGFIQPEALPRLPDYFDRLYAQHWSPDWIENEFESTYKDLIFISILRNLERRVIDLKGHKSLLDIGAHVGRFLYLAAHDGWQAEGIELNPLTSAFAARRTGLPVHRINAAAFRREGRSYSAITLTDVLEHIPEPVETLKTTLDLLAPGGWLAVKVPFARSQLRKERVRSWLGRAGVIEKLAMNLAHVNHFSPQSLKLALQKAGFERISIMVGAPELADVRVRPGIANRMSNAFRRAVYFAGRVVPGGVYSPLALNLQGYARRPRC